MIDYIKGKLTELNPTYAVIEAAGVGYEINISLPTYSALLGESQEDVQRDNVQSTKVKSGEVKLYVNEIIREDTHDLYGFFTTGERQLFIMLMTVSGIGANTARMIMSAYTASEIRQIIATGNSRALAQIKGMGPKTAQRIIVDLKDKVLKIDLGNGDASLNGANDANDVLFPVEENPVKTEAVSALTMLGFAAAASGKAVDKILKNDPTLKVEAVIREALKML
ncbi:MAG: Holliday junction branch migration protein RuvA [Paludibacteraceae bacterium]|nr:Holliday junction branch migration protein RuvA [Paludibacteraceae bacterium]MBR2265404.1 Holliday junction branch migration protein RuvA [Paludibacteraceae bacterium]